MLTLEVKTPGESTKFLSLKNGEPQPAEVKDGEALEFTAAPEENQVIETVTVDGAAIRPEAGTEHTYKIDRVTGDTSIHITVTEKEEPGSDEEPEFSDTDLSKNPDADDSTAPSDKTDQEQTESKPADDGDVQDIVSDITDSIKDVISDLAPGTLAVEDDVTIKETRTIKVDGDPLTLGEKTSLWWDSHAWNIERGDECISLSGTTSQQCTVQGRKPGEALIAHTYSSWNWGWTEATEYYKIIVESTPVESITLQTEQGGSLPEDGLALQTGTDMQLRAIVTLEGGDTKKDAEWSSSNPEIVSVDNGTITAHKAGKATITATAGDKSASVQVTVTDIPVAGITITPDSGQIYAGGTLQFSAEITPEDATEKAIEWSIQESDSEIATITDNGLLTGLKAGTVTVTAASKANPDMTATCQVTVKSCGIHDLYVTTAQQTVTVGKTTQAKAITQPADCPHQKVTWTSSDETVATVDEDGTVTTLKTGTATITGTLTCPDEEPVADSVTITVEEEKAASLTISGYDEETDYLIPGDNRKGTVSLKAEIKPANVNTNVTWSSSDESIATVDENGKVTAKKQGDVTITAMDEISGKYDTVTVRVFDNTPKKIDVEIWMTNQYQNQKITIQVPANGEPIDLAAAMPKTFTGNNGKVYSFTGTIRCSSLGTGTGNQVDWEKLKAEPEVIQAKYSSNNFYYKNPNGSWTRVGSNKLCAFYEEVRPNTGEVSDDSDIKVTVGDWPGSGKKVIQVLVKSEDGETTLYDSGDMQYVADNTGVVYYGKIKFHCDESRYEVTHAVVKKVTGGSAKDVTYYYTDDQEPKAPEQGIEVGFSGGKDKAEKYTVTAYVRAKEFNVTYDTDGGSNGPAKEVKTAVNGNQVTVSDQVPTKEGYIFAGWQYGGTTYYGGESFEMPPNDVSFVAQWIPQTDAIYYKADPAEGGFVTRNYEKVRDGMNAGTLKGSAANAKQGYRFDGWYDSNGDKVGEDRFFKPSNANPATYTAKFVRDTYRITAEVENGTISHQGGTIGLPGTVTIPNGADATFSYAPNPGYVLDKVIVDGQEHSNAESTYTFTEVNADHSIKVIFKRDTANFEVTGYKGSYDGKEHSVIVNGEPLSGETVQYSTDKSEWKTTNPTFTNVSDMPENQEDGQIVYVRIVDNDNKVVWEGQAAVKITPRPVTIKVKNSEKTFGDDDPEFREDSIDGLIDGDTLGEIIYERTNAEVQDAGTYEGVLTAKITEENPNYSVTVENGNFTIHAANDNVIKIKVNDLETQELTKVYDGEAVTVQAEASAQGSTITYQINDGNFIETAPTFTDVGTYQVTVKAEHDNYVPVEKTVTVTITKRPVTITGDDLGTRTYTGETFSTTTRTAEAYDAEKNSGLVSGHVLNEGFTYTLEGTNVGTYEGSFSTQNEAVIMAADNKDVTGNYQIEYKEGKLVIAPRDISPENSDITVDALADVTYNALEQKQRPLVIDGEERVLIENTDYTLSYDREAINAGTVTVTITGTGNYSGKVTRTYEIKKAQLTITVENKSKAYGEKDPDFTGEVSGWMGEDGQKASDILGQITYFRTDARTDDGEKVGVHEKVLTASYDKEEVQNYTVQIVKGNFEIVKAGTNAVTANGYTGVYDGQPHAITAEAVVDGSELLYSEDGESFTPTQPQFIDAGEHTVYVKATHEGYEDTAVQTAAVTITKRPVTVTGASFDGQQTYTGEIYRKEANDWTAEAATESNNYGLLKNHTISGFTYKLQGITAGTYNGAFEDAEKAMVQDGTGKNVTANYEINYIGGTLKIVAQSLEELDKAEKLVVSGLTSVTYNGTSQIQEPVVTTQDGRELVKDVDYTLAYSNDTINAGTVTVTITGTGNYDGEVTRTYEISKASLTIKANDAKKVYGDEDPIFTSTVTGLVPADVNRETELLGTITCTRTDKDAKEGEVAGEHPGVLQAKCEKEDLRNYEITYESGNFTIEPRSIIAEDDKGITVNTPENYVYNGDAQEWIPEVKAQDGTPLTKDTDYTVQYEGDTKNVTESGVTVTITGINNYTGTVTRTYKITPAHVQIKVNDKSKAYGEEEPEFTGAIETLKGADTIEDFGSVTYYRTNTDEGAGTYEGVLTAKVDGLSNNYTYEVVPGTFTINPADGNNVTIKAAAEDLTKVYDSQPLSIQAEADKEGSTLWYATEENGDYSTENPTFTDAGVYTVYVKAAHPNYTDTEPISATVTITPRPITVTGASLGTLVYNGSEQRSEEMEIQQAAEDSSAGLLTGHVLSGLTYELAGTAVGEYKGTFSGEPAITQEGADGTEGTDVTKNYAIIQVPGTLTITARPVTPQPPETKEDLYKLTIHYVYEDGSKAAEDVVNEYEEGTVYGPIYSPAIEGYTPNYAFVRSDENGMPASDVEVTVVYTRTTPIIPDPGTDDPNNPDNPDNPDNPGNPDNPDNPVIPIGPVNPVNPNPTTPNPGGTVTPAAPATAVPAAVPAVAALAAAPVAVPAVAAAPAPAAPVGAAITQGVDGNPDIVPVEDEEVPLANKDLGHQCCILHFLLMLAALVIYGLYTRSVRNRQKRIEQLKNELERESVKRKERRNAA